MPRGAVVVVERPGFIRGLARALRSGGGKLWRRLRYWIERRLHPMRRRRAHQRLAALGRPRRILVVCLGNICRSPYLEAVLRRDLPDVHVESGGFVGPGRAVPAYSSVTAGKRGLDLSAHRSRQLNAQLVANIDLLVVMDAKQERRLRRELGVAARRIVVAGDLDPGAIRMRTIRDPFRQPIDVFESCFNRLDLVGRELVAEIKRTV
jgi:protein-tyrosine phosphatase